MKMQIHLMPKELYNIQKHATEKLDYLLKFLLTFCGFALKVFCC